MKKSTKTIALRTQTIGVLTADVLGRIVGGTVRPVAQGFIMQDTKIVATGSHR